jgi:pyruvate dehydrogenase E1 component beta subunit
MATMTLSQAFQQGMREEMARDSTIFVMGTDLAERGGHFGQVQGLSQEFGADRIRDTPISESAMVAAGIGAAISGMRPVVDLNFIDFAYGAMDEILNQAAKIPAMYHLSLPLVIRGTAGVAGYAHQHNNTLEGVFGEVPGLSVVYPSTPDDARGLLKQALRGTGPVVYLMHKKLTGAKGEVRVDEDVTIPFGVAATRRSGRHATVATYGFLVTEALKAAELLAAGGIEVEVIDIRTTAPLDVSTIVESVKRTGRLIVFTEAPRYGGVGAEIVASVQDSAFAYLDAPVDRLEAARAPIPHSPSLVQALIPSAATLVSAVRRSLDEWPASL